MKKLVIVAALSVLSVSAFAQTATPVQPGANKARAEQLRQDIQQNRAEIKQDRQELHQMREDRRERRQDGHERREGRRENRRTAQ